MAKAETPFGKAAEMKKFEGMFDQADVNMNGRLSLQEFKVLTCLIEKDEKERHGGTNELDDAEQEMAYQIYNTYSEEDGISKADFEKINETIMACVAKIDAEAK